jgi:hypothetical protein
MEKTHTCFDVSKKLKEFLGESAPAPMDGIHAYYCKGCGTHGSYRIPKTEMACCHDNNYNIPSYSLHDLLSKPFCEAFGKNLDGDDWPMAKDDPELISKRFWAEYFDGGLSAVERALMEMMKEGK